MKTRYNKKGEKINNALYFTGYTLCIIFLILVSLFIYVAFSFQEIWDNGNGADPKNWLWGLGISAVIVAILAIVFWVSSGANNYPSDHTVVDENNNLITSENIKHSIVTNFDEPHYSNLDELPKLKKLLDDGIITQEEFELKKKQLLGL